MKLLKVTRGRRNKKNIGYITWFCTWWWLWCSFASSVMTCTLIWCFSGAFIVFTCMYCCVVLCFRCFICMILLPSGVIIDDMLRSKSNGQQRTKDGSISTHKERMSKTCSTAEDYCDNDEPHCCPPPFHQHHWFAVKGSACCYYSATLCAVYLLSSGVCLSVCLSRWWIVPTWLIL